jgi:hypothetical protein
LLLGYLTRAGDGGGMLLLVYWALNLPVLGQEVALMARQYPAHRNVTLRLLEPLGAPEETHVQAPDLADAPHPARSPTATPPGVAIVLGLLGLAPAFVAGRGSLAALAIGLGGMLLAYRALHKLATGLWHLAGAAIAWEQVAPLFKAAVRPEVVGSPAFAITPASSAGDADGAATVLVIAHP